MLETPGVGGPHGLTSPLSLPFSPLLQTLALLGAGLYPVLFLPFTGQDPGLVGVVGPSLPEE